MKTRDNWSALRRSALGVVGAALLSAGCGRVIEPREDEVIESGVCDPAEEWHVVDNQIAERAVQSLLWFGDGPILATQWSAPGGELSSLERYQADGQVAFRTATNARLSLLSATRSGFLAVGHASGRQSQLAVESHDGSKDFVWRLAFETDEDVWPDAVYELGGALLVVGTQEVYSGSDTDVAVFGLSQGGELRFSNVYGEDPPVLGRSSDERVVGSYATDSQVVVVMQKWLDGSGGPLEVLALSAAGETLWRYTDGFDYARGSYWRVAPTADGGALVVGSPSAGGISSGSARLLRLSHDGDALWIKTLEDADIERPEVTAAVVLPNGDFFLSGLGRGPVQKSWRLSAAGETLSAREHTSEELGGAASFTRVERMPAGGVLLVSETLSSDKPTLNLLRADQDGNALWQHQVVGDGVAVVSDVVIGPDGQVVMAGRFALEDATDERHVVALSDGCQL